MSSRAVCPETKDLCIEGCLPRGCKRQDKPRIYFENGRWFVLAEGRAGYGVLLRESAFAYAKAVWERRKK